MTPTQKAPALPALPEPYIERQGAMIPLFSEEQIRQRDREWQYKVERAESLHRQELTRHMNFVLDLGRVLDGEPTLCAFPEIERARSALAAKEPAAPPDEPVAFDAARDQVETFRQVCKAVNETPVLMSMLYDLDLMPEQTMCDGKNWRRTCRVAGVVMSHLDALYTRAALPAGWKAVPIEPTKAMYEAAQNTPAIKAVDGILATEQARRGPITWPGKGTPLEQAWAAMLAAVPDVNGASHDTE